MSEFLKRKLRKYFATFDFNADGFLSGDDLIEMAIQFAKYGNPEKQKAEQLKTHMEKIWELYSKNGEIGDRDKITRDEFVYTTEKLRYDPELMKHHAAVITDYFEILDLNCDGYLQEDEFRRMMFQMGSPDQSFVKMAFKAIDVNGDGKLSLEEFTDAYFHFMFSEDEESPNKFFFGPLDD